MKRLNPDKLHVTFEQGMTRIQPLKQRHYTLTHSDITAELFLTISSRFATEKITPMRDEVLAEWKWYHNQWQCHIYLHIDQGEFNKSLSLKRLQIFKQELPLALEAIHYGDSLLFKTHPYLNDAPIFVTFNSSYQELHHIEYWGTFSNYTRTFD